MRINFQGMPAVVWICPVCAGRHVGGEPGQDEETARWVEKHGKWHEASPLPPPPDLVLP